MSGLGRRVLTGVLRLVWAPLALVAFRQRTSGRHTLPDGGFLLLANHVGTFDSPWLGYGVGRPVWFMASAPMFRNPVAAMALRALGAFPKEVGVADREAAGTVERLVRSGEIVQIMPEGVRTWDGRPGPVAPGTGRMIRRLGVPVVVARFHTGHLWWPRWARWPRWVPVVLELQPPRTFGPDLDAEAINAEIQAALATPVSPDLGGARVRGFRTAEGLPDFLWACPRCFQLGGLRAERSRVRCEACAAAWEVTVDNRLAPVTDGAPAMDLGEADDAIVARYGDPPVADPERFGADGVALEGEAEVLSLPREGPRTPVGTGTLRLTADALTLDPGWSVRLDDLVTVGMDVGNVLLLRTPDALFRVAPLDGGTRKWDHFVRGWRARSAR